MRLDKFLSESLIEKRRKVRIDIKDCMVKVNGVIVNIPATDIDEKNDIIEYCGLVVKYRERVYYMFNKPSGCITARKDKISKTVFDYFNDIDTRGVFHVGRLDKDTEGLLLITNDGDFEHKLMHPTKHVEKKYYFWALGYLNDNDIRKLENGVYINKGEILTKPAKVEVNKQGLYNDLRNEIPKIKEINYDRQPVVSGYLTISEGCKHQVKRMLKAVGCYVVYLKRISIGGLMLDESLKRGEYRELTKEEVKYLLEID